MTDGFVKYAITKFKHPILGFHPLSPSRNHSVLRPGARPWADRPFGCAMRPIILQHGGECIRGKREIHSATRAALTIVTPGSSIWPFIAPSPLVGETGAARIVRTTSIPSITRPNAAKSASKAGMSVVRMKKSDVAVPGPLLAIEIVPATWLIPVAALASWAIGGRSLRASLVIPP